MKIPSLYSSEFHSCCLSGAIFSDSTLADTHFYDCVQHRGGFIRSRLRRCNTLDALMTGVTFAESTLDGCSFDRVRANRIRGLHTATITQGGATEEECRHNREAIYKALRAGGLPPRTRPAPARAGAVEEADGCAQKKDFKSALPMWALLTIPVLWLATVAAYAYEDGMTIFDWMGRFSAVVQRPFAIHWTLHTPKFLLGGLVLYVFAITLYYSTSRTAVLVRNTAPPHWGDVRAIDRKYRDRKHPDRNVILTQHLQMGLNGKQHRRNLLQIIIGGSGAGKTRFLVSPTSCWPTPPIYRDRSKGAKSSGRWDRCC